jgi:hypothetical protein
MYINYDKDTYYFNFAPTTARIRQFLPGKLTFLSVGF